MKTIKSNEQAQIKTMKSDSMRRLAWLITVIVIYIAASQITPPAGLSVKGWKAIILIVCATITWITDFIPLAISSCMLLFLPQILAIEKTGTVMQNFATSTLFFIMSALIIAKAFIDVGLGYRVSLYITPIFGKKSKMVLLALMSCTAVISTVLADIPTAIIVGGIAYTILQKNNCKPGESVFGKMVMMGIPIASAIGGIATPAGSGVNILSINLLKSVAGIEIGFLQWTIVGLPCAIILTIIAWFVMCAAFKPEMKAVAGLDDVAEQKKALGPMTRDEKKFAIIFAITIILWFTQAQTGLEVAFVSFLTSTIFFLPGIKLMDWKRAQSAISWETLMLVGSCNALAMILSSQGSAKWLSDTFLGGFASSGLFMLMFIVTVFGIFIHLLVPISGAVMALTIPIIAVLAKTAGINPIYLVLPLAYTASCVFLIPLDPTTMTTYGYGYWKLSEMPKVGFIIAFAWIPLLVALLIGAVSFGLI